MKLKDIELDCKIDIYETGNEFIITVTHLPTRIWARVTNDKSKHRAKQKALKAIREELNGNN